MSAIRNGFVFINLRRVIRKFAIHRYNLVGSIHTARRTIRNKLFSTPRNNFNENIKRFHTFLVVCAVCCCCHWQKTKSERLFHPLSTRCCCCRRVRMRVAQHSSQNDNPSNAIGDNKKIFQCWVDSIEILLEMEDSEISTYEWKDRWCEKSREKMAKKKFIPQFHFISISPFI